MLALFLSMLAFAQSEGGNFIPHETSVVERLTSFVGIFMMVGVAWLISENRKAINWRPVAWGVGLQLLFGAVVLSPVISQFFFTVVNGGVNKLLFFSGEGANFVFQSTEPHAVIVGSVPELLSGGGTQTMFVGTDTGISPPVKTFAFWILPTIVFFSSLMSVLYYLGVMQALVKAIAWVMMRTLGTSGAESLSAAGNIFVGQTEAPLLVKPFVATMTRSELIVGAVGMLQFDVVAFRLREEYGADCVYDSTNIFAARWVVADDKKMLDDFTRKHRDQLAVDGGGHLAYLAPTRANLQLVEERWPEIRFLKTREH